VGGSVNVVIRGAKSLTGNNQALFVDGGTVITPIRIQAHNKQEAADTIINAAAEYKEIESINVEKKLQVLYMGQELQMELL
jgi:hypothetical protein